ncbi:hypothetical protein P280DRAFT_503972 [Massarina eburnea CBS 473.64]|uniref:Uncharacterized protein n=1 Tax=Massarina eburnea CBS 473.64 TaxID=1395130 RepID=A0A6A6SDI5_9PLEO|nr:hypothetical protein P280DRAFT_503972 [Massarina eburnea CBS 473.64]
MGEDRKTFDVADFNHWKRKQGSAYKSPPRANLLAATNHIRNVLEGKKINWAVVGSLAMLCLGSRRSMPDIHVVYDDREFSRIKLKLESDRRVRLQKSMNPLFPSKLLISTGPKHRDAGCTENVDVEVNLIPPGSHGTPTNDILKNSQVMLRLNQDGQTINLRGLNMLYLVKTTIHFCKTPNLVWDARKDLLFLCRNYGKDVGIIRGQLNAREVQENFLGTDLFSRLSPEDQRICYSVLFGKDPPPIMSFTPPPPGQRDASSSRPQVHPQISSHKSSPALNAATQQQPNLLTPPLPRKSRPSPARTADGPPSAPQQGAPRSSSEGRDARSRYHKPNSASHSRNVSREVDAQAASRAKSMEMRGFQHSAGDPSYRTQLSGVQNVAHVAHVVKPQATHNASSPTSGRPKTLRPQKSVPVMVFGQPTGAHGQTLVPPMPRRPADASQTGPAPLLPAFGSTQPHKRRDSLQEVPLVSAQSTANNHSVYPPRTTSHQAPPSKGLRVVGPDGLYSPPPLSQANKNEAAAPTSSTNTNTRSAPPTPFIFELDASSPQATSAPPTNSANGFIAELPAEVDGAGLMKDLTSHLAHMVVSPPLPSNQPLRDSPVSPPMEHTQPALGPHTNQPPLQMETQHSSTLPSPQSQPLPYPQTKDMPPNLRSQSDPLDALPSILTIGGPGKRRSPSNSVSYPSPAQHQQHVHAQGLLSPEAKKYIPDPNRVSMYKAYSAPSSPPKQPATAPDTLEIAPLNVKKHAPVPAHQAPAMIHGQAPLHPNFMQAPIPSQPLVPLQASTFAHHPSPPRTSGHPSQPQQRAPSQEQHPSMLRAGPAVMPPRGIHRHLLPNPLGANPPTPPVLLIKQDSHQGYSEPAGRENAAGHAAAHAQQLPPQIDVYNHDYHEPPHFQPGEFMPSHQRNISSDSHTSTTSHDSEKLAQEYQMDLPAYGEGYSHGNGRVYETLGRDADNETVYDFT